MFIRTDREVRSVRLQADREDVVSGFSRTVKYVVSAFRRTVKT
jgi:hypothetical protein